MKKKRSFTMKKSYASGGKVKGADHSEGGISAEVGNKQVAEIEGEERIFSKEDTIKIEEASKEILCRLRNADGIFQFLHSASSWYFSEI